MKEVTKCKAICKFCGRAREYQHVHDDGRDWSGHCRGSVEDYDVDAGCECEAFLLSNKKIKIKPMCMNCQYNKEGYCVNDNILKSMSKFFEVKGKLLIKDVTKNCENYKFNIEISMDFIEIEEEKSNGEKKKV